MSKEKIVGVEFIRLCATIGVIMNHVGVCWISAYGDTANANGLVLFKSFLACAALYDDHRIPAPFETTY